MERGNWPDNKPPVVIVGPTATGKTDVALELAERIQGEIVNADSMQVYIGMDIGTAKPDREARQRIPFHLLDVVRPDQPFSVSEWKERAEMVIQDIAARDKWPIVCGGTGLYVRALLDDWSLAETPADPAIRQALQEEAEALGSTALHERLCLLDPPTSMRLHPNDALRIIRALEVIAVTGQPISAYQQRDQEERTPRPALRIGLTLPRPELYARIERRVETMLQQGLEAECRKLLAQGCSPALHALRSLGYKEMIAFLSGETDFAAAIALIKQNTRRYAKRQQTWFRADPHIQWLDVSALNSATVAETIREQVTGDR